MLICDKHQGTCAIGSEVRHYDITLRSGPLSDCIVAIDLCEDAVAELLQRETGLIPAAIATWLATCVTSKHSGGEGRAAGSQPGVKP